jgi:hypothetical protein
MDFIAAVVGNLSFFFFDAASLPPISRRCHSRSIEEVSPGAWFPGLRVECLATRLAERSERH